MRVKRYTPEMEQWIKDNSTLKPKEDYKKFCEAFSVEPNYKAYLLRRCVLGCSDAKAAAYQWTDEKVLWMKQNNTDYPKEDYKKFCETFSTVTYQAYMTKRSRLGLKTRKTYVSTEPRLKKIEKLKRGYLYIRGDDGKWVPKGRYIYEKQHPEYTYSHGDNIIFLDGDITNFDKANLAVVYSKEKTIFYQAGGVVKGSPNLTRINILKARLKLKMLDMGEKAGLVKQTSGGRKFIK